MKALLHLAAAFITLAVLTGCASTTDPGQSVVTVNLEADGSLSIYGEKTDVVNLAASLKSLDISPLSTIRVKIPGNTPARTRDQIWNSLRKGGYRRVFFLPPPKSIATVK